MKEYFKYDNGNLVRLKSVNGTAKAGAIVGTLHNKGYLTVMVNYKRHYVHRIIWEMHYGPLEDGFQIDHINGDRMDNRIENLRKCTNSENNRNKAQLGNNSTGHKNIGMRNGYYRVQLTHDTGAIDKQFKCLDTAIAFATAQREKYHGAFANHI